MDDGFSDKAAKLIRYNDINDAVRRGAVTPDLAIAAAPRADVNGDVRPVKGVNDLVLIRLPVTDSHGFTRHNVVGDSAIITIDRAAGGIDHVVNRWPSCRTPDLAFQVNQRIGHRGEEIAGHQVGTKVNGKIDLTNLCRTGVTRIRFGIDPVIGHQIGLIA